MTDPSRTISEVSSSEATRKEIAKAFAPVVWLHKDDEYRPSSVDWYLARASLEYNNNKKKILEEKNVTAESLINQKVGSDYSDFTKQNNNRNQRFNLKIENVPSIMQGDFRVDQGKVIGTPHVMCLFGLRPRLRFSTGFSTLIMGRSWGQGPMKQTGNILRSDFAGTTPRLRMISKKYTFLVIMRGSG